MQVSTGLSTKLTQTEGLCCANKRLMGFLSAWVQWCLWDGQMEALVEAHGSVTRWRGKVQTICANTGLKNKDWEMGIKMNRKRTCNSDIRNRQKQKSKTCQGVQGCLTAQWVRVLAMQA